MRRGNMSQYSGDVSWNPLLRRSDAIRNLRFEHQRRLLRERHARADSKHARRKRTLGIQFENNGSINFTVNQTFDRLVQPFAIRSNVAIPVGDYDYRRYTASINSGTTESSA